MESVNLTKFPVSLVQDGSVFCIPACILSVLKYYDESIPDLQFKLMQQMIIHGDDHSPSLGAAIKGIQPYLIDSFMFEYLTPDNFDEWLTNITDNLRKKSPLIFTTRTSSGPHIRVMLQYDETNSNLIVYNPGLHYQRQTIPGDKGLITGGYVIIQSGLEGYPISQAKEDWTKPDKCTDQLLITPIGEASS